MDFADRIKYLRNEFDISSSELADLTGIHPVSIRKYESHRMVAGMDIIDKMCDALELPRMIFEGMPPQHTNYEYTGDFYQQLLLLMNNGTLIPNMQNEGAGSFTLNPLLGKHIEIKNKDMIIPLEDLTININPTSDTSELAFSLFTQYMNTLLMHAYSRKQIEDPEELERLDALVENQADRQEMQLMLFDHSVQQHIESRLSKTQMQLEYKRVVKEGGDYYSFIEQLDMPESAKKRYIEAFENKYVTSMVTAETYPWEGTKEERAAWRAQRDDYVKMYKSAHPGYHEAAKQYALEEAAEIRGEGDGYDDDDED